MMQPLQVYAMDVTFERVAVNIPYTSLQWNRKYYESGTFEMCVPVDVYDESWAYIATAERYETGIVQKVEYSDEGLYGMKDTVVLSGFFLEELLNSRTFLDESPEKVLEERHVEYEVPNRTVFATKYYSTPLYQGDDGEYYYFNKMTGNLVSSRDDDSDISFDSGVLNPDKEDKYDSEPEYTSITINTPDGQVNASYVPSDYQGLSNFYVSNVDTGEVTYYETDFTNGYNLTEHTGQLLFTQGDKYWYTGENGKIYQAFGSTKVTSEDEVPRVVHWKISSGIIQETYYEEVIVDSAWQRLTDSESLLTEGEVISKAVGWVQALFGDSLNWAKTEITGSTKTLSPSFKRCGDFLHEVFKEEGVSYRITYNFINDFMMFEVWKGNDRTQGQTQLPWTVFSDDFGTIKDFKYTEDDSNYRNRCFVLYDYEEPEWDEEGYPVIEKEVEFDETGHVVTAITCHVKSTKMQGYKNVILPGTEDEEVSEIYLDCRNDECPYEEPWLGVTWEGNTPPEETMEELKNLKSSYDSYFAAFDEKGIAELSKYKVEKSLDVGEYVTDGYLVDFDLGDVVETGVEKLGVKQTSRIVGAYEVHEAGRSTVQLEFEEETLTEQEQA